MGFIPESWEESLEEGMAIHFSFLLVVQMVKICLQCRRLEFDP